MKYKLLVLIVLISLTTGVSAAEVEVSTQQDWNQGDYSGTSADRNDNSGDLGLGYRNGTSSDSLVGYWRLDRSVSGSGGTVLDYSGNGNDGKARNGVNTGIQGVLSTNSFSFDGNDDYVELDSINPNNQITVSSWVKSPSSDYNALWSIVSKYDAYILGPRKSDDDRMCFIVHTPDNSWNYDSCYSVSNPSKWHHFVGTYDASSDEVKLYMDGQLVASDLNSGGISDDNGPIHIGHREGDPVGTEHYSGKIEEIKIYNKELSSQEVKELYLEGLPLKGNYSQAIQAEESTKWDKVEVDTSSLPTNTDVDAVFRAKDSSDNLVDEQVIDLQEGKKNYSLDVADSEKADIVFNGTSSDVTNSWEINSFRVFAGFCDFRGPKNECVINSTRQLEPQTYDVSSIFEARSTAIFEAFSGTSVLNISNSSRLSGTWKGSFDIQSTPVTIEPGASFKPENGRIIIGK